MMAYSMAHIGINVLDLDRSVAFYRDAFGMKEVFRMHAKSKLNMVLCFMSDERNGTLLTLVWCEEKKDPYDLGDNNIHINFVTDDFETSYHHHKEMGIVCIEELSKHIYYVEDPDGYEIAIVPEQFHPTYFSSNK